MKIKSEDILKPGAVLKAEKIDFNDPIVKQIISDHHKEIRKLNRLKGGRFPRHYFGF